jgi:hypothetical protein
VTGCWRVSEGPTTDIRAGLGLSDFALSGIAAGAKLLKPICERRMRA